LHQLAQRLRTLAQGIQASLHTAAAIRTCTRALLLLLLLLLPCQALQQQLCFVTVGQVQQRGLFLGRQRV